jgi:hypothetical protein
VDWRELSEIIGLMLARLEGRRRGRRALEDIMWFFFLLAFGGDYEPTPSADGSPGLEELTAQATGIDSAKATGPLHTPWPAEDAAGLDVVRDLRRAGVLQVMDLAAPIRDATDDDLDRARDDGPMFSRELATIAAAVQLMLGDDVGGLGSLTAMAAAIEDDAYILIYAMLDLRTAVGDAPFDKLWELTQQEGPHVHAIVEVATAVPGAGTRLDGRRDDELHGDIADQVADLCRGGLSCCERSKATPWLIRDAGRQPHPRRRPAEHPKWSACGPRYTGLKSSARPGACRSRTAPERCGCRGRARPADPTKPAGRASVA